MTDKLMYLVYALANAKFKNQLDCSIGHYVFFHIRDFKRLKNGKGTKCPRTDGERYTSSELNEINLVDLEDYNSLKY